MLRTATVCLVCVAAVGLAQAEQPKTTKDSSTKPRNAELQEELLKLVKEDQKARKALLRDGGSNPASIRKLEEIDRKSTARLKAIIDRHGWPGRTLVSEDGAHAAWLLAQHADRDRPFQKRCLALLQKAVKAGEALRQDLAYLTDRVLVAEGKKQRYGTQFRTVNGKLEPQPIEDEAGVDRRRKEVGLGTLAEYRKLMEEAYRRKPEGKK